MLLPVFCAFVPSGSSGRINRSIFMRTNAVNTAAFPKMDTHIDFYKVPIKLLMTRYEEFKLNISDANSSSLTAGGLDNPPASMPFFDMQSVSGYFASTAVDDCGFQVVSGSKRLWDLLDYNDDYIYRAANDPNFSIALNSLRLQAYQKVYYDHYRNTAYESNRPQSYNADKMYTGGVGTGEWQLNDVPDLFRMHYVNYRKDFFMNIYPALNYVVSSPTGTNWIIPPSVVAASSTGQNAVRPITYNISNSPFVASINSSDVTSTYTSVQAIRAAFALDKLMRLSAYAPKHVKDQMEARFGLKQHASSGYESQYLGSFKNDIVIGEVTSTADTSSSGGAELGTIGGRGVGAEQMGHDINFDVTADDNDSIIIGVMYTLCRSAYDSFRIDAFNFKFTREDIFNPEFMDLGLRPVTLKEMYTPSGASYTLAQLNTILGYVPRDQEYKLGIDENHGLFRHGEQLGVFVNHSNVNITQRGHTLGVAGVNRSFFKISPSDLDDIFMQAFDESDQKTDQFFGELTFKFVVRQNMSVHGQPRL